MFLIDSVHVAIKSDSRILLANDTEFCAFGAIYAAGIIMWYGL